MRGVRNWLIVGERNAAHDSFYEQDLDRWRASGVLTRVAFAFSRDQEERVYVGWWLGGATGGTFTE